MRNAVRYLAAVVLAGCMDVPTSSSPPEALGPEFRQLPTGTPAECPSFTTGASGILPGSGALYSHLRPPGIRPGHR